ncbi:MAG TPA: response regulator [Sedimentisphaerales bacterium]|nr:response regulator [Sedimentisphaerales bacterium]
MNKKKILLVDDEKDTLMVLEKQLTMDGYAVVTADSGTRALSLAKSEQPDLIVLDIKMPDMDGGEVAFRLTESPITKDIPIVYSTCLLSGNENYKSGEKIMLAKSKDSKELIAVIGKVLAERSKK